MDFQNCYEDDAYAAAYSRLEFPGTYYLAFRDLPELITGHVCGRRALDFGCGTGRSTRFLVSLGFRAIGVDIAPQMIARARAIDPAGDYRPSQPPLSRETGRGESEERDGTLGQFDDQSFDLVLAAFTFDNIPTRTRKVELFSELRRKLAPGGRIVNLVSSPEIYWHEWASFSTREFPENRSAGRGDEVRIIVTALEDRRPAVDILWPDEAYRDVYAAARLQVLQVHKPLGRKDEPYEWISETTIAPWSIYLLGAR
jgi:SAM-dependent methyltransferase